MPFDQTPKQVIEDFIVEQLFQASRPPALWGMYNTWKAQMPRLAHGKALIREYVRQVPSR